MLRLTNKRARNNLPLYGMIFVLLMAAAFLSCENAYIPGFMDLRPIGMDIEPGESDEVLPDEYSPVIISFDTKMKEPETEGVLQIICGTGTASGDRLWKDNQLYFMPSPPWTAGTRYVINLSGTVRSADGRELRLERYISFYAINRSDPPLLEQFSPADGASVGTGGLAMEFRFSCPMDRLSVESTFTIDGVSDKTFQWSDDDRLLAVTSHKALLPWVSYHWTIKGGAKSRDGVPLATAVSGQFTTDLDKVLPQVSGVFPVLASGGSWLPTGGSIGTDLGPGQGIAVQFNKAMGDNVLRSLRFEPALAGRTEMLGDSGIVFIPNRDPDPETAYTIIVSADTKDAGGLKLGADYRVTFVPDIPYLHIISFSTDSSFDFVNGSRLQIALNGADPGLLRFTVRFSQPFVSAEAKQDAALKITLNPFFPGTLDPIALRSASWPFDDRMHMEWERLRAGSADEPHLYRLVIPGGRGGVNSGGGTYFEEDQVLYLEVL